MFYLCGSNFDISLSLITVLQCRRRATLKYEFIDAKVRTWDALSRRHILICSVTNTIDDVVIVHPTRQNI